jgi:hypothetical protein
MLYFKTSTNNNQVWLLEIKHGYKKKLKEQKNGRNEGGLS